MKKMVCLFLVTLLLDFASGCKENSEKVVSPPSESSQMEDIILAAEAEAAMESENRTADIIMEQQKDVVNITERLFVGQINDIFMNPEDYDGKKIQYEGFYTTFPELQDDLMEGETPAMFVLRPSPGCCGDDGFTGFQIVWDGDCPSENNWVRVVGNVRLITVENQFTYLVFDVDQMEVLTQRGQEFVAN